MSWFIIIFLVAINALTAAGFYRVGYHKGFFSSHEMFLQLNENFWRLARLAKNYERQLEVYKELKEREKQNGR